MVTDPGIPVFLQDRVAVVGAKATSLHAHSDGSLVFLSIQETFGDQLMLVMARAVSQCDLESSLRVSIMLVDKNFGEVLEEMQDVLVDI